LQAHREKNARLRPRKGDFCPRKDKKESRKPPPSVDKPQQEWAFAATESVLKEEYFSCQRPIERSRHAQESAPCLGLGLNLLGYSDRMSQQRKIRVWENESDENSRFGKSLAVF
jgi:hypothetical protein